MQRITIKRLEGIPNESRHVIFDAMSHCTNSQRLAVCLYFMSELPVPLHHISRTSNANCG